MNIRNARVKSAYAVILAALSKMKQQSIDASKVLIAINVLVKHAHLEGAKSMAKDNDDEFPDDEAVKRIVTRGIKTPKGAGIKGNKAVQKTKTRMGRKNIKTKKKASAPFKRKFKG